MNFRILKCVRSVQWTKTEWDNRLIKIHWMQVTFGYFNPFPTKLILFYIIIFIIIEERAMWKPETWAGD